MAVVLGKIHWLAKLRQHVVASLRVRACPQYHAKLPHPPPKSSQPFNYCVSFHFEAKWLKGEVMSRFIPFIIPFSIFMSSSLPTSPIPVSSQNQDTSWHSIVVATLLTVLLPFIFSGDFALLHQLSYSCFISF